MQIEIKSGQSIYDLAIMYGYGVEGITQFMSDTGINSIESSLLNRTIQVTKKDNNLSNYINSQRIVLASDIRVVVSADALLDDDGFQLLDDDGGGLLID